MSLPFDLSTLDLAAYLRRIGYAGALDPGSATLEALHLAHASRIPFENLDILLGRPIRLDLGSLQAKLVRDGRGGYCFEQNLLLAAVLGHVGFDVTPLAARVRYRITRAVPRTHALLVVETGGERWLADVGFGLEGLLMPVPLRAGAESTQYGRRYRIVAEAGGWALQMHEAGAWTDLYAFTPEPQLVADFEMASHYTSTLPASPFVRNLVVQLPGPERRKVLRNRELAIDDGATVDRRTIESDDELLDVLAREFGLRFAAGTRFAMPDALA